MSFKSSRRGIGIARRLTTVPTGAPLGQKRSGTAACPVLLAFGAEMEARSEGTPDVRRAITPVLYLACKLASNVYLASSRPEVLQDAIRLRTVLGRRRAAPRLPHGLLRQSTRFCNRCPRHMCARLRVATSCDGPEAEERCLCRSAAVSQCCSLLFLPPSMNVNNEPCQ